MQAVSIIGYGSFGQLRATILSEDIGTYFTDVWVTGSRNLSENAQKNGHHAVSLTQALSADVVFCAMPISQFEGCIQEYIGSLDNKKSILFIDLLSVKLHPQQVFEQHLVSEHRAMLLHPMFGPQSYASNNNSVTGLPCIMDQYRSSASEYKFWHQYFLEKKMSVIEMDADTHDRIAAKSQGITHFVGRVLKEFDMKASDIDTVGAKKLQELMNNVCHDSDQLFQDMMIYNPYCIQYITEFEQATQQVHDRILGRKKHHRPIYAIQGGKGSFNEQAIMAYCKQNNIIDYDIQYAYTSQGVLESLNQGHSDFGIFALNNNTGGVVQESLDAMGCFTFRIVDHIALAIQHVMMKKKSSDRISHLMAHSQVFLQCEHNLQRRYPQYIQQVGVGKLSDTAAAAEALALGIVPDNVAIVGPAGLASLYDLDIIATDLQDNPNNITNFMIVTK